MSYLKWILLLSYLFTWHHVGAQNTFIEAQFIVDYAKEDEFGAHIVLNNKGTVTLQDWRLGFTFLRAIDSVSGASVLKQIGDYYVLGALKNDRIIPAHSSVRIDLIGKYTIKSIDDAPSGYFITYKKSDGQQSEPIPVNGIFIPPQTSKVTSHEAIYALNIQHDNTSIEGNPIHSKRSSNASLIVPQPAQMSLKKGEFTLKENTSIVVVNGNKEALDDARYLVESIAPSTGYTLKIIATHVFQRKSNVIYLVSLDKEKDLGEEGYTLEVSPENVVIQANTSTGLFYGIQTLRQLFPPNLFANKKQSSLIWKAPSVLIKDMPRFPYRGILFDVARHFFSVDRIKRLLDLMAIHKLNVLHWHLSDDEGWRIEIKSYPQLTQIGGWRGVHEVLPPALGSGIERYGGFYTQEQIKDIVHYAQLRHITIIPEIDMPGHARAMIQSLPEQLLDPHDKSIYSSPRGFHDNVLSPCIPSTYRVVSTILSEVMELFPSKVIHVGGDELPQGVWEKSPMCSAFMKEKGLKNTQKIRYYFSKWLQDLLARHHRILAGWEEITETGSLSKPPAPLIYAWLGKENWMQLKGYDLVLSPYQYLYLEMANSPDPKERGEYWGGYVDTFRVYSYSPIPKEVSLELIKNIKGVEGGIWTEYIDSDHFDEMIFPKFMALAEVAWTQPSLRNWKDFSTRLGHYHLPRFDYYGLNYRLPSPGYKITSSELFANVAFPGLILRYTLDGLLPTIQSTLFVKPVEIGNKVVTMCTFNVLQRNSCMSL